MATSRNARNVTPAERFIFALGDLSINSFFFEPFQRTRYLMTVNRELLRRGRVTKLYTHPLDCARQIRQKEGLGAFWRGTLFDSNLFPLGQVMINHLLSIGVITIANTWTVGPSESVLSDLAGNFIQLIYYPAVYVQQRLQCDVRSEVSGEYEFQGPMDVIRRTYKEDGIRGFYSGVVPFVLCNVSYRLIFESMQQLLTDSDTTRGYMLSGLTAMVTAGLLTYPFNLVARRVALNPLTAPELRYRNWWDCALRIYRDEGVVAFYDGLMSTAVLGLASQVPAVAFAYILHAL